MDASEIEPDSWFQLGGGNFNFWNHCGEYSKASITVSKSRSSESQKNPRRQKNSARDSRLAHLKDRPVAKKRTGINEIKKFTQQTDTYEIQ